MGKGTKIKHDNRIDRDIHKATEQAAKEMQERIKNGSK